MGIVGPGGGGGSPTGAAGGQLAGEYPNPTIAAVTAAAIVAAKSVAEPTWTAVEAINAELELIAEFETAIQCAIVGNQVFLRGTFKPKIELAAKTVLFTLPVGFRPEHKRVIAVGSNSGTNNSNYIINVNGTVETVPAFKVAIPNSIDGCNFPIKG